MPRNNNSLAIILGAVIAGMLALSYASVPLYRLICQKTGFGGTPQKAILTSDKIVQDHEITVQFVANVHRDLPWEFRPVQHEIKLKIGENGLAYYFARNKSAMPIIGMATYNVSPDKAGIYFNKVQCFCFEQQLLKPGQGMEMPVLFFVDPEFAKDPNTKDLKTITLSYTFFEYKG